MPIEPETERLRLRQWTPEDRAPFAALNADPRVMEYLPAPLTSLESNALADRIESSIAERGWGLWAAELKSSDELIGFVGLEAHASSVPYSPCVEVGWRLAYRFWGAGLATEAAKRAMGVGFEDLGLDEIVSFTSVLNLRSRAVMERLKMLEDPVRFDHPRVAVGSRLRLHCGYRMSKERWTEEYFQTQREELSPDGPLRGPHVK